MSFVSVYMIYPSIAIFRKYARFDLSVQATFYVQSAFAPRWLPIFSVVYFFSVFHKTSVQFIRITDDLAIVCISSTNENKFSGIILKGLGISQNILRQFQRNDRRKIVSGYSLALLAILLKRKFFPLLLLQFKH